MTEQMMAAIYTCIYFNIPYFNLPILIGSSTPDSMTGSTLGTAKKPALLNHKLNNTEITAVRQLVTGYRESAAFLLRSADELEHLLQIQPKL